MMKRAMSILTPLLLVLLPVLHCLPAPVGEIDGTPSPGAPGSFLGPTLPTDAHSDVVEALGAMFTENRGQLGPAAGRFYIRGGRLSMAFGTGWVAYHLVDPGGTAPRMEALVRATFPGCRDVEPEGVGLLHQGTNFIIGDRPEGWVTDVGTYEQVWYRGVWEGVDLRYRFQEGALKYDIVLAPGADPATVRVRYEGFESMGLEGGTGALLIGTPAGTIRDSAPVALQGTDGGRPVPCRFLIEGGDILGFHVGPYDPALPLVIDPRIEYSTFLGGGGDDGGVNVHLDEAGDLYVTGNTTSPDFPASPGSYQFRKGAGTDMFAIKLTDNGTRRVYCTFVGGDGRDECRASYPDANGSLYLAGGSESDDFPTSANAYDSTNSGESDVVVAQLDASGRKLLYGTYIGGQSYERALGMDVDGRGCIYLTGYTKGPGLPTTPGAYQESFINNFDSFAIKINGSGRALDYCTYIASNWWDVGNDIHVDESGCAYLTGYCGEGFTTTPGAYLTPNRGDQDVFVIKLNPQGTDRLISARAGGSHDEAAYELLLDDEKNVYIAGTTKSQDMPTTPDAFQRTYGGGFRDGMVMKFNPALTTLLYASYLGGEEDDLLGQLHLMDPGTLFLLGHTMSADFPTTADGPDTTHDGMYDLFLSVVDLGSGTIEHSTFFGRQGTEQTLLTGEYLLVTAKAEVYFVGTTENDDFPTTPDAYQDTFNGVAGTTDGILVKYRPWIPPRWRSLPFLSTEEDVAFVYDFAGNVSDPDTPLAELNITSSSPYVNATEGLEVKFLFPDGVTRAQVPLTLSDGFNRVQALVNFTVQPVNDPPSHNITTDQNATEEVDLHIDLADNIWDIDNPKRDLSLIEDDPYTTVDGLTITVHFPEGVLDHDLELWISDGDLETRVVIHFDVEPVDDPPVIDPLDRIDVVEDEPYPLDLSGHVHDVDTPQSGLTLRVWDDNVTVDGLGLTIHFTEGGFPYVVTVEVFDGNTWDATELPINVIGVNDAPEIDPIPLQNLTEEVLGQVDLGPYIHDEDNEPGELSLQCGHPSTVYGLTIELYFESWRPPLVINFSVFDGIARTQGSFEVWIEAVNDPPVISVLRELRTNFDLTSPFDIAMDEGTERWYQIIAYDEDDEVLRYSLDSTWVGAAAFANGTMHLSSIDDVGLHECTLTVDDRHGGVDSITFEVEVLNVNQPPSVPHIRLPAPGSTFLEGEEVIFSVDVSDPDLVHGDVLTVTWESDMDGMLTQRTSDEDLLFITDSLSVGRHHILVTVTDGEEVRWTSFNITIRKRDDDDGGWASSLREPTFLGLVVVLLVLLLVAMALRMRERGRSGARPERWREMPIPPSEAHMADAGEGPVPEPATGDEDGTKVPTEGKGDATQGPEVDIEREVHEVTRALIHLPHGLPSSLWGLDKAELGRAIVEGEKRVAPDGTPLVRIGSEWYIDDRSDMARFLREWDKGPGEGSS